MLWFLITIVILTVCMYVQLCCGYSCVLVHIVMCVVLACMCVPCIIVVLLDYGYHLCCAGHCVITVLYCTVLMVLPVVLHTYIVYVL